jgi:hypothetical protein
MYNQCDECKHDIADCDMAIGYCKLPFNEQAGSIISDETMKYTHSNNEVKNEN